MQSGAQEAAVMIWPKPRVLELVRLGSNQKSGTQRNAGKWFKICGLSLIFYEANTIMYFLGLL